MLVVPGIGWAAQDKSIFDSNDVAFCFVTLTFRDTVENPTHSLIVHKFRCSVGIFVRKPEIPLLILILSCPGQASRFVDEENEHWDQEQQSYERLSGFRE